MTDKEFSQYDPGGVLKSAHDDNNQALRITNANTSVPSKYSRVELTYNASGSVTNAKFYQGTFAEWRELTFVSDVSGSLNNTYFTLYSENDESLYHVWYNVNGAGVDPAPANSISIEVQINTDEVKEIVCLATKLALDNIEDFKVERSLFDKLKIDNTRKGLTTNSVDNGTGFDFNITQQGQETLLKSVDIPYDGVVKHIFNTQEKKFEVVSVSDLEANVDFTSVTGQTPNIVNLTLGVAGTESSTVLPVNTVKFTITERNSEKLQFSFTSGQSGTNYITVKRGVTREEKDLEFTSAQTLYVQAPSKDNAEVEILYWI